VNTNVFTLIMEEITVNVSHVYYSEFSELGRTKSGKRAGVKPVRTQATKKTAKGKCPSGKLRLKDHKDAVRTLHKAKTAGQIELAMNGATNRQETRTYFCGMCKGHHLTSKREWTTFTGPVAA
jgi:hypothetical protein